MARSSVIRVSVIGDAKDLEKTFDSAEKKAGGFGDKMSKAGNKLTKGVTAPALAAGAAVVGLGLKAGQNADRLLDMAAQTGVSTDKLQEMEYVATQAGVSQDWYMKSVDEVIKAQDRLQKGTGPAAEALDALGVSVKDANGEMRSAEAITDDAMKALASIEDPSKRAALAQDIFKRQHLDLLPVLDQGTDTINEQRKAAHDLGVVQSKESLDGANKFRAGMESLQAQLGGVVGMIGGELAPVLSDVVLPLIQDYVVPAIRSFAEWVRGLAERFRNLSPEMQGLIGGLAGAAAAAGPVLVAGSKLISSFGAVGKAFAGLSKLVMANPWVAIIAGTIALVTLIVTNWDKIKGFLGATWQWIKDTVSAVGQWFKDRFNDALEFVKNIFLNFTGPGLLIKHFDKIREAVTRVKNWITEKFNEAIGFLKGLPGRVTSAVSGLFRKVHELVDSAKSWVINKFDDVVGFVKGLPGRIARAASGMWDGIKDAFRSALNWLIDKWNNLSFTIGGGKLPDWLGGGQLPSFTVSTPNIPRLHSGGTFRALRPGGEGLAILRDRERVHPGRIEPRESEPVVIEKETHHHWNISTPVPSVEAIVDEAMWRLRTAGV